MPTRLPMHRHGHRLRPRLLFVILLVLGLVVAGCANGDDTALEEAEEEGTAEGLVGESLTVSGEVTEVFPSGAFVIAGEDFSFGEPLAQGTLIVPGDAAEIPTVEEEGRVQVTGTVREFLIADFEDEFGFDFEDDLFVEYEEEFAIVADTVEFVPPGTDDETAVEEAEEEDAELIEGETVTISGEVEVLYEPHAFRLLGEAVTEGTLVIGADTVEANQISEGDVAQVTGTVTEFVIVDVEDELGIDLDDDVFVEFEDELVVIADSVDVVPD